ncbi:hypothetical protein Taro_051391 [Colocasia esculenta]|uniref:Uncharacterized protein n=1 Tax=Colocasia esculenta TaxID=4460 RepID=A0A843XGQ7_COLES|nr:hypothetical protein [Colocasia esculenta]
MSRQAVRTHSSEPGRLTVWGGNRDGSGHRVHDTAVRIDERSNFVVSPPVGLRGALSAIGISGDYCGPSVSGMLSEAAVLSPTVQKRGLWAVCEGELQHRPYLVAHQPPPLRLDWTYLYI